jgi:hypothetical protein
LPQVVKHLARIDRGELKVTRGHRVLAATACFRIPFVLFAPFETEKIINLLPNITAPSKESLEKASAHKYI